MKPLLGMLAFVLFIGQPTRSAELPKTLTDRQFWQMVTDYSETGGQFASQLMSNEDSFELVIPSLVEKTPKGGVYLGVGSEQNFTYIAATEPALSFIFDIRRDNLVEHLMYKALFELAPSRTAFVSRLFARQPPAGLSDAMGAAALFAAYQPVAPDAALFDETLAAIMDRLRRVHGFPIGDEDAAAIARMLGAFRTAGPHSLKGYGDNLNLTFALLMAATDNQGRERSFLASEASYRAVRDLQMRNVIVPVVGDFAGDKALASVGRDLKARGATVNVFYVSNVERYLFEQGEHGKQFYANVAALPLNDSSLFIRSVTTDISRRLGIPIPDGPERWRTFLYSIPECLAGFQQGRIPGYKELFEVGLR